MRILGKVRRSERLHPSFLMASGDNPSSWLIWLNECQPLLSPSILEEDMRQSDGGRANSLLFDKETEFSISMDQYQKAWKGEEFLPSFFGSSCIDALHIYWIFTYTVLCSEVAQWGWKEEVLITRAGKPTLIQATKELREESQVLYVMISVSQWVECLHCHFVGHNPWSCLVFLILHHGMEPFSPSGICHLSVLQSLGLELQGWEKYLWEFIYFANYYKLVFFLQQMFCSAHLLGDEGWGEVGDMLSNMVATSHMWPLITCNVASATC